jgi:iron-sulfur cluster repair protein YtfE (RIC family)
MRRSANAARRRRALDVLKASGINHCCGAQLTLREGAAAGVPLETLLATLCEAVRPPH